MTDYRVDKRERPRHHAATVEQLKGGAERQVIDFSRRGQQGAPSAALEAGWGAS